MNFTILASCLLIQGVELAEQNYLTEAIEYFTRAIELDPQQPSPYNNRAQAYQLQNNTMGKYASPLFSIFPLLFLEASADLNTAIELATRNNSHRKVLCLALTQRGILNRFLGEIDNFSSIYCIFHFT